MRPAALGLPRCQCGRCERRGSDPWVGKTPCRRARPPTPVFSPGESHGQRSLAGHSPQGRKESDTTARLHTQSLNQPRRPHSDSNFSQWRFSQSSCLSAIEHHDGWDSAYLPCSTSEQFCQVLLMVVESTSCFSPPEMLVPVRPSVLPGTLPGGGTAVS